MAFVVSLLLAIAIAAPAAGTAGATTRARAAAISGVRADKIALRTLGTLHLAGMVALFGERTPLPAGDVVSAWSLTTSKAHMPSIRLRHRAWLFWEDMVYGAELAHPSELLVVNGTNGRVLARMALNMVPLINGAEPSFAPGSPGYVSRRYLIYSTVSLSSAATDVSAAADRSAPFPLAHAAQGLPPNKAGQLKGQCLITIGDRGKGAGNNRGNDNFHNDLAAVGNWARSAGLLSDKSGSSVEDLKASIYKLLTHKDNPCKDFMIYIAGDGRVPNPDKVGDVKLHYGPFAPQKQGPGWPDPGIQLTANKPDGSPDDQAPQTTFITPDDIDALITTFSEPGKVTVNHKEHTLTQAQVQGVKFKLKLQSCYSGWFAKVLLEKRNITPGQPKNDPLALVESSSSATEPSWFHLTEAIVLKDGSETTTKNDIKNEHKLGSGGVVSVSEATNANLDGLTAWLEQAGTGPLTLEQGIQQAFKLGASDDFTRVIGYTHPQVLGPGIDLGTPDPSTKDTTFITKNPPGEGQGTTITTTTGPITITMGGG